jgi:cephalosporin-C deacetylase-like acetyl esterase
MPTTTYAAYNSITAPKTLSLQLATGHNIVPTQNDRINAWIQEIFRTEKAPPPKEESFADR